MEYWSIGTLKECGIVGSGNMGFCFSSVGKRNLHLVSFCLKAVWFFHMVKALVRLLLAPTLGPKAPQSPLSAPVDLHLLVVDVLGHDVPLLGGRQYGEGCSDEHPHTAWHQVEKIIVSFNLSCFSHTTDDVVHLGHFCCCWCWHPAWSWLLRLFFALLYHHHDDQEAAAQDHGCNGTVDGWVEGCLGQGVASRLVTFAC